VAEEPAGRPAGTGPVIEHERELTDLPGDHLTAHHPGPRDDPAEPEDGDLGIVDDRRAADNAALRRVVLDQLQAVPGGTRTFLIFEDTGNQ
jgi:hypothetical protein